MRACIRDHVTTSSLATFDLCEYCFGQIASIHVYDKLSWRARVQLSGASFWCKLLVQASKRKFASSIYTQCAQAQGQARASQIALQLLYSMLDISYVAWFVWYGGDGMEVMVWR